MGCVQSQQPQGIEEEKLDFRMELTKVEEFDNVFQSIAEPLLTVQRENTAFSKGKRGLKMKVGTRKRLKDQRLADTLMAMMYCYSTATNGDLTQLNFTKVKRSPYIDVDKSTLRKEFQPIPLAFEAFISQMTQVIEKLEPLAHKIAEAAEQCADFPERATSLAEGLGLGIIDTGKAVLHTKNNVQKLRQAKPLLQKTLRKAHDIAASLAEFVDMLDSSETMEQIKNVGRAANEAQCFKPDDIVSNFWPDKSRLLPLKQ